MKFKSTLSNNYICFIKNKLIYIFVISFLFMQGLTSFAQNGTSTVSNSSNILINKEFLHTVTVLDGNQPSEDDVQVITIVNNPDIIELKLSDPEQNIAGFDEEGNLIGTSTTGLDNNTLAGIASTADNDGQITFSIKGVLPGNTTINFNVDEIPDVTPSQLNINVINVAARFSTDPDPPIVEASRILTFNDESIGDNIVSRKWDFGDDSTPVRNQIIARHIFTETGIHYVNLEITSDSTVGPITTSTSTAVSILSSPDSGGTPPEGTGSVHGIVWFEKTDSNGGTFRFPLARAVVTLVGIETLTEITNLRGIFNFDGVPAGNYDAFACKSGLCDKSQSTIVIDEDDDENLEFIISQ